ncbi:uncharacterized protein LOC111058866 isoform X2 [Nilaparvata lugens]|nr:uncharacterized protein LOC111058866 isoform X2 [Nilaparvata lugens]XP_039276281.1 uncharacterized protein LOC111058866 isoform X2 [Nilaparvata lugens]
MVSNEAANVRFYNVTQQQIEVLWINFAGRLQRYVTLEGDASVDVNTYVNHLWVFRDTFTHTEYLADGQLLFHVTPSTHPCPYFRRLVRITYPLLTLSEIAANATRAELPMVLADRPRLAVSYTSTEEVQVVFNNLTLSDVNIFWVAPDGHQTLYLVCNKHQTLFVRTVVGHLWLAEETLSGRRLLIDGKRLYVATRGHSDRGSTLALLDIRSPLHTLAELARMALRRAVYLARTPVRLEMPATLLRDLDRGRPSYQIH